LSTTRDSSSLADSIAGGAGAHAEIVRLQTKDLFGQNQNMVKRPIVLQASLDR
jgi:hypothetical protein